jgi:hypothetical protein
VLRHRENVIRIGTALAMPEAVQRASQVQDRLLRVYPIDVWMRGGARLPLEEDLAVDPKVSGFLLGFDLDDEVNVVPDRTQKGLHAEVGALESPAGRKAGGVNLVEWVLPDFI